MRTELGTKERGGGSWKQLSNKDTDCRWPQIAYVARSLTYYVRTSTSNRIGSWTFHGRDNNNICTTTRNTNLATPHVRDTSVYACAYQQLYYVITHWPKCYTCPRWLGLGKKGVAKLWVTRSDLESLGI